jgi:hypothetical protein
MSLRKKAVQAQLKQKALEPQEKFCYILQKKVPILVEYPDYRNPQVKGDQGSIYCGNILPCYHNEVKCRYSGISPLYRDPFVAVEREDAEVLETSENKKK